MKKFEVGKSYQHFWAGDADAVTVWQVVKRTPKTITIKQAGKNEEIKKRVRVETHCGVEYECVDPFGRYSMSPVLCATRELYGVSCL